MHDKSVVNVVGAALAAPIRVRGRPCRPTHRHRVSPPANATRPRRTGGEQAPPLRRPEREAGSATRQWHFSLDNGRFPTYTANRIVHGVCLHYSGSNEHEPHRDRHTEIRRQAQAGGHRTPTGGSHVPRPQRRTHRRAGDPSDLRRRRRRVEGRHRRPRRPGGGVGRHRQGHGTPSSRPDSRLWTTGSRPWTTSSRP